MIKAFLCRRLPVVTVFLCLFFWCVQWWFHDDVTRRSLTLQQREAAVLRLETEVQQSVQKERALNQLLTRLDSLDMGPRNRETLEAQVALLADQWGLAKPSDASLPSMPSENLMVSRQGDFVELCQWLRQVSFQCPVARLLSVEIFEMVELPGSVLCRVVLTARILEERHEQSHETQLFLHRNCSGQSDCDAVELLAHFCEKRKNCAVPA